MGETGEGPLVVLTGDAQEEGETTVTFIMEPETGSGGECDIWAQDCTAGEKCAPFSNNGEPSWNSTRCVPVDADAGVPGDACTVENGGTSGFDSCATASMCWNVDTETGLGVCVGFCEGSPSAALCSDSTRTCSITNDGVLPLCLQNCDPIAQDCVGGEGCYGVDDGFVCAPDVSADGGNYGDPCAAINVCAAGLACLNAEAVPDCAGDACCSPFCDLFEGGAAESCPGFAAGQDCVPGFEKGDAPPGLQSVGYCAVPI